LALRGPADFIDTAGAVGKTGVNVKDTFFIIGRQGAVVCPFLKREAVVSGNGDDDGQDDQERSEKISYDFVLSRARELKDRKAVRALEKIGSPPYTDPEEALKKMIVERKYVIRYGGAVKKGNFYPEAIKPLIFCREYTLTDKFNYLKGMRFTKKYLWDVIMKTNLFNTIPSQKIPIYILQGTSDYETTYVISKAYFDSLQAPVKKFYPFENSAHSPIFEESGKFNRILNEILSEQREGK